MVLRALSARWFELLTGRDELALTLRALAATGRVQLEAHSGTSAMQVLPALRVILDDYRQLGERYARYWPAPASAAVERPVELEKLASSAIRRLHAWASAADSLIARAQRLEATRAELELARDLVAAAGEALPNLARLAEHGPILASRAYLLATEPTGLTVPPAVVLEQIRARERTFLLALGLNAALAGLDESLHALKARRFALPEGLSPLGESALADLAARIGRNRAETSALEREIAHLSDAHGAGAARTDLDFIGWLAQHVPELPMTEHFAWVSGWTSDATGISIEAALQAAGVRFLLRYPEPPRDLVAPVLLNNPRWAQPFELFARLLGMPAASEADPSQIVALIAPTMFGFMFADVAQGAILLVAGVALRRRYPALAMLIPGGAIAVLFGALFGSVFAREDLLPALWVKPLVAPLELLRVSLGFGCGVVLIGLALDALQRTWASEAGRWWAARAGIVLAYLSIVAASIDVRALWALPAGLAWAWAGSAAIARERRLAAFGRGVGESLESLFQLLVNTLSFVRVGAFALAHAGLAAAVVGLAATVRMGPLSWAVLALGNVLMMGIEALVVAIQTSRLVLFEFFIRFLHGAGRPFSPLASPQSPRSTGASRRVFHG
ncbi:MAG TPA: hypothetical protein VMU67_13370 [Steroidobacteraceae bacterium]|nr:hypothetical protein [Steroidobacteraceae bacterium]